MGIVSSIFCIGNTMTEWVGDPAGKIVEQAGHFYFGIKDLTNNIQPTAKQPNCGPDIGLIVGIVIAIVVTIVLIIVCFYFLCCRKGSTGLSTFTNLIKKPAIT